MWEWGYAFLVPCTYHPKLSYRLANPSKKKWKPYYFVFVSFWELSQVFHGEKDFLEFLNVSNMKNNAFWPAIRYRVISYLIFILLNSFFYVFFPLKQRWWVYYSAKTGCSCRVHQGVFRLSLVISDLHWPDVLISPLFSYWLSAATLMTWFIDLFILQCLANCSLTIVCLFCFGNISPGKQVRFQRLWKSNVNWKPTNPLLLFIKGIIKGICFEDFS